VYKKNFEAEQFHCFDRTTFVPAAQQHQIALMTKCPEIGGAEIYKNFCTTRPANGINALPDADI
jgi:hypothetical protein